MKVLEEKWVFTVITFYWNIACENWSCDASLWIAWAKACFGIKSKLKMWIYCHLWGHILVVRLTREYKCDVIYWEPLKMILILELLMNYLAPINCEDFFKHEEDKEWLLLNYYEDKFTKEKNQKKPGVWNQLCDSIIYK